MVTKSKFNNKYSITPYSHCSHGCIYCYFNHNKDSIPKYRKELICPSLEKELNEISPQEHIIIGTEADSYPPIEGRLKLTREIIKSLIYNDRSFSVCTKSNLILRDADLLRNYKNGIVRVSLCSSENSVLSVLEPKAPDLNKRISTINELMKYGIEVEVDASPWVPGILNINKLIDILPDNIKIYISPLRNSKSSVSNIDEEAILEKYLNEVERFPTHKSVIWSVAS